MFKNIINFFLLIFLFFLVPGVSASSNSYVSIVNPVRGEDFWEEQFKPDKVLTEQINLLRKENIPATYLIRFDALKNNGLLSLLQNLQPSDEKGLFLEITSSLTNQAGVKYNKSYSWHSPQSVFLTGYSLPERIQLIDTSFDEFKKVFGFYPKSVGAWWVDAFSIDYMQKKYGILTVLIVADQYSTDNYQIWGQYWSTPYYPSKINALFPASTKEQKIPVVMVQWAARDPVNGYGKGVEESTLSVQANDYIDYHGLGSDYFAKLVDIYTKPGFGQLGHLVVGLENSYSWEKYGDEYKKQIEILKQKNIKGQFSLVTMSTFASNYKLLNPDLSPTQVIVSDDPLGTENKSVWFMNNHYRVGWFYNNEGSVVRDIRQYVEGQKEICYEKSCESVNFATFATRVLDDVTYGQKWVLDQGKISQFKVQKLAEKVILSYKNNADVFKSLEFLPRDITYDSKTSTIDGLILDVTKNKTNASNQSTGFKSNLNFNLLLIFLNALKFILFLIFCLTIPGMVILKIIFNESDFAILEAVFLSTVIGLVLFTICSFSAGFFNLKELIFLFPVLFFVLFIKFKLFARLKWIRVKKHHLILGSLVFLGTFFQVLPVYKSGLEYQYGIGFWGPNTHDGVWHLSLITQLVKNIPAQNPIFAGEILKNYHYFYDLLVSQTTKFSFITVSDLVFRVYPIFFSVMLGVGSFLLSKKLFNSTLAAFLGIYFVYFAGSFGFIVSILKKEQWGGESAFWANQSISFNLNPPFAVSILILITFLVLLHLVVEQSIKLSKSYFLKVILLSLLAGSLIAFKAYGAILLGLSLLFLGVLNLKEKNFLLIILGIGTSITSLLLLLPQYSNTSLKNSTNGLFIFNPFWFIHAMVDNPDRVGWLKLAAARDAYLQRGEWFKYILTESVGLLIFIIGNFGMRIIGIVGFIKKDIAQKNLTEKLMITIIILSILIPVLFIQAGNPWNAIQFIYYGLFLTALYSGLVLRNLFKNLPNIIKIAVLLIILVVTPISSITTALGYRYEKPHAYISTAEKEALDFLSQQPEGVVLTFLFSKNLRPTLAEPFPLFAYDSTAYVSAYSKKRVFIEDEIQNEILQTDYAKRLTISKEIFAKTEYAANNLSKNNIRYIYLLKIYNKTLDEQKINLTKIFENEQVNIYKVN